MMKISEQERQAINTVVALGHAHGFGNLIGHLQTAWAEALVAEGMPESTARLASGGSGYPFAMAADLRLRGEWDETGERYRQLNGREGTQ